MDIDSEPAFATASDKLHNGKELELVDAFSLLSADVITEDNDADQDPTYMLATKKAVLKILEFARTL